MFAQLISGLSYLHHNRIVHRDLKLENLLLDGSRNIIITDFGFANTPLESHQLLQTSCGSPCYAAPELVTCEGYIGEKADIWSCGVILYAMICGYLPYDDDPANPDGDNINLLYKYIMETTLTFPPLVSDEAKSLLNSMLVADPCKRATLKDIRNHPWLQSVAHIYQSEPFEPVPTLPRAARDEVWQDSIPRRNRAVPKEALIPEEQSSIPEPVLAGFQPSLTSEPALAGFQRSSTSEPVIAGCQRSATPEPVVVTGFHASPLRENSQDSVITEKRQSQLSRILDRPSSQSDGSIDVAPPSVTRSSDDSEGKPPLTVNTQLGLSMSQRPKSMEWGSINIASAQSAGYSHSYGSVKSVHFDSQSVLTPGTPLTPPTPKIPLLSAAPPTRKEVWENSAPPKRKEVWEIWGPEALPWIARGKSLDLIRTSTFEDVEVEDGTLRRRDTNGFVNGFLRMKRKTVNGRPVTPDQSDESHTGSGSSNHVDMTKLRYHSGPIDQQAVTTSNPREVLGDVIEVLIGMGMLVQEEHDYKIRVIRPSASSLGRNHSLSSPSTLPLNDTLGRSRSYSHGSDRSFDDFERGRKSFGAALVSFPTYLMKRLKYVAQFGTQYNRGFDGHIPADVVRAHGPSRKTPVTSTPKTNTINPDEIRFRITLHRIRNLPGLVVVDFKRLRGDIWEFKKLYREVIEKLALNSSYP